MSPLERADELDFDLARVIGYHQMRAGFYRNWHKRAMLTVVLALLFPAMALLQPIANIVNSVFFFAENQIEVNTIAAIISFAGVAAAVADILIDPAGKSARHRATELVYQSIRNDAVDVTSNSKVSELEKRYERVDSGFEDRHVIVNLISGNRVASVSGRELAKVRLWRKLLMHYFTFSAFRSD